MPRSVWKGAITFGLVHVPVAMYAAVSEQEIDFDWLDKRSMDPVGYQRINKRTGKPLTKENIVKGVKQSNGEYVVLSDAEIKAAYPQTTQTIEIEAFVTAQEIPFVLLERPFYLEPLGKSSKIYALLREAMLQAGTLGIARVVMHTKEHLAALVASGPGLVLNTLRWPNEIRSPGDLKLPPRGRAAAGLKESELKMARQLIEDMTHPWRPPDYEEQFRTEVMHLIESKVKAGKTEQVAPIEEAVALENSNVTDITALLRQSLNKGSSKKKTAARKPSAARKTKTKTKAVSKRTALRKAA